MKKWPVPLAAAFLFSQLLGAGFALAEPKAQTSLTSLMEREPNQSLWTATPVKLNSQTIGTIHDYLADVDIYKLPLTSAGKIAFTLRAIEPDYSSYLRMDVLDCKGNVVQRGSLRKYSTGVSVVVDRELKPDAYYVKVYTDGRSVQIVNQPYMLEITPSPGNLTGDFEEMQLQTSNPPNPAAGVEHDYWMKHDGVYMEQVRAFDKWNAIHGNDDLLSGSPMVKRQYHLAQIDAFRAWSLTKGNPLIKVAIIDQGIAYQTTELARQITEPYDVFGQSYSETQKRDHGTHTSGIIAADNRNGIGITGVAPGIKLMPINAWDTKMKRTEESTAKAIRYAADHGARVLNMSLGSNGFAADQNGDSKIIYDAIKYAYKKGVVLVAASGNHNLDVPDYPARYPEVIAVGAVDENDGLLDISNKGNDLVAPGADIFSTGKNGDYVNLTGTSMSSPMVAGAAALILSKNPELTPKEVLDILCKSSDNIGAPGPDNTYGYGRLNVYKALMMTPDSKEPVDSQPFTDIADHWAKRPIAFLWTEGIVAGRTSSRFDPEAPLTRAEFAVILAHALNLPSSEQSSFKDVKKEDWFYKDVNSAAGWGLVTGTGSGLFEPNQPITREEMAVMLVKAAEAGKGCFLHDSEVIPPDNAKGSFLDQADISGWAMSYVQRAFDAGFLTGRNNQMFAPKELATRAESAQVVYQLMKSVKQ